MIRIRPALLGALAAMVVMAGCSSSAPPDQAKPVGPAPSPTVSPTPTAPPARPVHASLFEGDGHTYGVGMPIIMRFSKPVIDRTEIEAAMTVTSVPESAPGGWHWFSQTEAHFRPQTYWPAHATITLNAPLKGVSAGPRLAIDNNLTLSMHTGAAHISTINPATLRMTVTSDGAVARVIGVSLGKPGHRTLAGVKVISVKANPERMISTPPTGPGSYNLLVPYSVRVTNSGEFIHAAPWNSQVGQSDQSHGCTNLRPADAKWFYNFSGIGDVVVTSPGPGMPTQKPDDGWGDWNLSWAAWTASG